MSEQISLHDESVDLFNPESQIPEEALRRVPSASAGYMDHPVSPEGCPSAILAGEQVRPEEIYTSHAFVRGMARLRHARKHP